MVSASGHARHWRGYVAVGIIAVIASGIFIWLRPPPPSLLGYREDHHESTEYEAGGPKCEPKVLTTLRAGVTRLNRRNECADKAEDRAIAYENVYQTRRGAIASEQSTFEGFYQARAAWVQTVLLFLAFAASLWAAWAASLAAKAADETLNHARRTSIRELRAYVAPRDGKISVKGQESGDYHCIGQLKLTNLGQTPASKLICQAGLYVGDWPQTSVIRGGAIVLPGGDPVVNFELWPTEQVGIGAASFVDVSPEEAEAIMEKRKAIFLYGTIEYSDAFGGRVTTYFNRYKTGPDWLKQTILNVSPSGNETTYQEAND